MANNSVDLNLSDPEPKEAVASESITPGELIEFGGSNEVQRHSTAGGHARKAFALINGKSGEDISTDYDSGDPVTYAVFHSGQEVNALLPTGSSEVNISKGDPLESAGDGTLQAHGTAATGDEDNLVAYALEAVDNSGGGSEARIKVEVA